MTLTRAGCYNHNNSLFLPSKRAQRRHLLSDVLQAALRDGRPGTNSIKPILQHHSFWLDFDALFEFAPVTLQYQFEVLLMLPM